MREDFALFLLLPLCEPGTLSQCTMSEFFFFHIDNSIEWLSLSYMWKVSQEEIWITLKCNFFGFPANNVMDQLNVKTFLNAALLPGRVAQLVPPAPAAQSPRSLTMERRREPAQGQCPQSRHRYSPNIRSLGESNMERVFYDRLNQPLTRGLLQ